MKISEIEKTLSNNLVKESSYLFSIHDERKLKQEFERIVLDSNVERHRAKNYIIEINRQSYLKAMNMITNLILAGDGMKTYKEK